MGPLEVLFLSLTAMFVFIGVVREYPRELGVTTVVLVAILLLKQFGDPVVNFVMAQEQRFGVPLFSSADSLLLMTLFHVIFIAIVFAAYSGETLTYQGQTLRGIGGEVLSALVGLLNGYLITGTIWYYLDKYNYPVTSLGLLRLPLDPLAQQIVRLLPQRVLDTTILIVLISVLILLRIRR